MRNNHQHRRPGRERESRGSFRLDGPVLIGRNSLLEVLRRKPAEISRVYLTESASEHCTEMHELLNAARIAPEFKRAEELTSATGSDSHQGAVAVLKRREHPELKGLLAAVADKPRALILLLDSIYDPHNLGAILRAGECFGVDGVIISKNRGTGITPAVTKSSVGASEFVPIVVVSNLAQALGRAVEEGFEGVAADVGEGSESLSELQFPDKTVLILGSEGDGIQPLLRKLCSRVARIPMSGVIDSLNVSQAASVFLYAWKANQQITDRQGP